MVTDAEFEKLPPFGVIVGVATVNPSATLSVKAVVFVTPPPLALTEIGKSPAGVDPVLAIFNIVEQVGLQEAEEKDPVAPEGNPATEKETDCGLPEAKVALMELIAEDPAVTDWFPELAREKLKVWVIVNEALGSALAVYPFLNALAFTVALLVRVIAPVYRVEDWVGVEPLLV
jgi:hypothetical protein